MDANFAPSWAIVPPGVLYLCTSNLQDLYEHETFRMNFLQFCTNKGRGYNLQVLRS